VRLQISEALLAEPLVEYCVNVRVATEGEGSRHTVGEEATQCLNHHNTFSMAPHEPGRYEVWVTGTVTLPGGQGNDTFWSQEAAITVREDAPLTTEEYARQEGFRLIYEFRHWSEHGGGSGHGSSLAGSASDSFFLAEFVARFQVTSLFDAGCGAMEWQPGMLAQIKQETGRDLIYHGADIVSSVVDANRQRFAVFPHMSFSVTDLAREGQQQVVPPGYEAVLCRHALFHNTNAAVTTILKTVHKSGAKWFVATTLRPIDEAVPSPLSDIVNADAALGTDGRSLAMGGYRPVELEAPPFGLPPPLSFAPELGLDGKLVQVEGRQQGLAVWALPFAQMF